MLSYELVLSIALKEGRTHLLDSFRVIVAQLDSLPHLGWRMSSLDRLDVQVAHTYAP
jgi:hypothetical protein